MEPLTTIHEILYDLARGPLVWMACIVFVIGTIFQVFKLVSLTRVTKPVRLSPGARSVLSQRSKKERKKNWALSLRLSIFGVNPFMVLITTLFHALLIFMPFFVLGHNILLDNAFGFSLPSLPEQVTDMMTISLIGCALVFLYRRLFISRVKAITDYKDYLLLLLATAPFITGFLAFHQTFPGHYRLIATLHMVSGELMLMAIPFTRFIHMVYLIIVRLTIKSEYNLRQVKGSRTW